jgi:hypothetical protein
MGPSSDHCDLSCKFTWQRHISFKIIRFVGMSTPAFRLPFEFQLSPLVAAICKSSESRFFTAFGGDQKNHLPES